MNGNEFAKGGWRRGFFCLFQVKGMILYVKCIGDEGFGSSIYN